MNQDLWFLKEQFELMDEARDRTYHQMDELENYIDTLNKKFFIPLYIYDLEKWKKLEIEYDLLASKSTHESLCLATLRKMMHEILNSPMLIEINIK